MLQRFLLLPLLTPLLAVLLLAAANPRPPVSLRLLLWRSPPLPLGVWIAAAAAGGAALAGTASALALRQPSPGLRRQVHRREQRAPFAAPEPWNSEAGAWEPRVSSAGPSRAPGEPAPTVSVPFRVIRRAPAGTAPAHDGRARAEGRSPQPEPEPVPAGDGWGEESGEEW